MSVKDIEFEWDEDKNRSNICKHGIDFLVRYIFGMTPCDKRDMITSTVSLMKVRWQTIGISRFGVLMVVYTDKIHYKESNVMIISARKAEPHEAKQYQRMTFFVGIGQ